MKKQLIGVFLLGVILAIVVLIQDQKQKQKLLPEVMMTNRYCLDAEYVNYKQVTIDPKSNTPSGLYKVLEEQPSREHLDKVKFVLNFYGIKQYKDDANGLKILCSLWNDKDLLSNITSKAKDSAWLKMQKYNP